MRILVNEIKKIFNWRMLLLLAFVNFVLYFLLIDFHITHFPNGRPALDSYRIGAEMIETYGIKMDETDLAHFKRTYDAQIDEANRYLQAREEFVNAGMDTYEKFRNYDQQNEQLSVLHAKIMFEEKVDLFWELQERERLIDFQNNKEAILETRRNDAENESQRARFEQMMEAGHYQVYPEITFENYKSFIRNAAIVILVSVVLVMSPIMIHDRSALMLDLQYTTKKGRAIYKTKIAAGLISTWLLITALLTIYFAIYSFNDTSMFFPVPVHMFINPDYYWYDPTFFQYIVIHVAAIYVIGFIFMLIAVIFSTLMPNYVSLIGIQIPFVIGMIAFGLPNMLDRIIDIRFPQWAMPALYSLLAAASIGLAVMTWKREKRRDIVM